MSPQFLLYKTVRTMEFKKKKLRWADANQNCLSNMKYQISSKYS